MLKIMSVDPHPSILLHIPLSIGSDEENGRKIAFLKKQRTKAREHKIYAFKLINLEMMSRWYQQVTKDAREEITLWIEFPS